MATTFCSVPSHQRIHRRHSNRTSPPYALRADGVDVQMPSFSKKTLKTFKCLHSQKSAQNVAAVCAPRRWRRRSNAIILKKALKTSPPYALRADGVDVQMQFVLAARLIPRQSVLYSQKKDTYSAYQYWYPRSLLPQI